MPAEDWCITKMILVFEDDDLGPVTDEDVVQQVFKLARTLAGWVEDGDRILNVRPLEEELRKMGMPIGLRALVRYLTVVDKRPSAAEVLESEELRDLERV